MKQLLRTFLLVIIVVLFSSHRRRLDTCGIIEKVKYTSIKQFSPTIKFGFETRNAVRLNQDEFKELFGDEMIVTDTCYLFGKFKIAQNRIGILALRNTYECDARVEFIELHILDNCKLIGSKKIMIDDSRDGPFYSIASTFNKNYSQLTIREQVGSEYSQVGSKTDTLFTNTFKINLKSKTLDTIYRNSKYEILKSPPSQ